MPFSISYYSPVLQYKQSRIHSFIYLLFHFLLDPDPCGSGSATLQKLLITGYCLLYLHRYRYSVCLLHWRHRGLTIFRIVSCPWCSTIMLSRCRKKLSRAQLCWLQRFCTSHFCLCPFAPQNPEKFDDLNIWKKARTFKTKYSCYVWFFAGMTWLRLSKTRPLVKAVLAGSPLRPNTRFCVFF